MGVDRERRLAEGGVEHYVRSLAPDAGQRLERRSIARRLTAVPLDDRPRKRDDVLGLGPIEPDGLDPFGKPLDAERRHLLGRVGDGEQRRRDLVDAGVGRLRRKHHRHQERERIDVFELALRRRIGCGQPLEDRLGPRRPRLPGLFSRHGRFIGARSRRAKRECD